MSAVPAIEAIAKETSERLIEVLDHDSLSDAIDNTIIEYPEGMDPESPEGLAHYDEQFGRAMRDITLRALGLTLVTLGTAIPAP